MYELRRHIFGNTVDRITIKKLVNRVFLRCECRVHHQHQLRREGRESTCEGEVSVRGCHGNELSDIEDDKVSLGDNQSSDALVRPSEGGKVADCEEFQEGTRRNDIKITRYRLSIYIKPNKCEYPLTVINKSDNVAEH